MGAEVPMLLGLSEDEQLDLSEFQDVMATYSWRDLKFYRKGSSRNVRVVIPGCPMGFCAHAEPGASHTFEADELDGRHSHISPVEAFKLRPAMQQMLDRFA